MIIYILFSITLGIEGGFFELKGKDVVSPSFGPSFGIFCDFPLIPNLSYTLSLQKGSGGASTRTAAIFYDSLGVGTVLSGVVGEEFKYNKGILSTNWLPFSKIISPSLSLRLGLISWSFVSEKEIAKSLNGNEFKKISLFIGGGGGVRSNLFGFLLSIEAFADFIFSEDKDWETGFGNYDDNEWSTELTFRVGKQF
ncbi:MAG: hypothetical protein ABIN61_03285 [candidate division WOR-3 bacterium]